VTTTNWISCSPTVRTFDADQRRYRDEEAQLSRARDRPARPPRLQADAFRFAIESGGKRLFCGGSLYKDKDYNQIPKIRDRSVAAAKQLCASVKL